MERYLFAADIGGTTSRIGFFTLDAAPPATPPASSSPPGHPTIPSATPPGSAPAPRVLRTLSLPTAAASGFPDLLAHAFAAAPEFVPERCRLGVFAVAGAVRGGFCRPPNIAWSVDVRDAVAFGFVHAALVNDFAAQAYGSKSPAADNALTLQPRRADLPEGVAAVIGAGTGLGHCALVPDGLGGWIAAPSEAGHAGFPFVGGDENAFGEHLRRTLNLPFCHAEAVVSGAGLASLYSYVTGEEVAPRDVPARLAESPRTVETFARFYGRAARNYALAVLSLSGVMVTGGVAARSPELVRHPAFLAEFRNSRAYGDVLSGMAVRLNRDENLGLFGAALYGARTLRNSFRS